MPENDIKIPKNRKNLFTIRKPCVNMYPVEIGEKPIPTR